MKTNLVKYDRSIEAMAWANPAEFAEYESLVTQIEKEETRELCQGSLLEFLKHAWTHMGETARLSINWHHEVVIESLEDIAHGDLRNLVINIPPRHSKSLLVNVAFPAWLWIQDRDPEYPLMGPHVRFLSVSFAAHLSERFGLKMLNLVMGDWYQSLWGDKVRIRMDQQSRAGFANTRGGERISASVEGGILGRGGDIIIADDPHNVEGAESEVQREATLRAFSESLSTRVTDPRIAARILIMQRLHGEDSTNWALDHWPHHSTKHLMFPARYDPNFSCPEDPRRSPGEPLWTEVWSDEELAKMEVEIGPYAWAGQFQQVPTPREGGIIDIRDWNVYPEEPPDPATVRRAGDGTIMLELPEVSYVVLALDTAMSEDESADWNAAVIWGVWHRRRSQIGNVIGLERPWFAQRWSSPLTEHDVRQQIVEDDEQPRAIMMEAWRRRCKLNDQTPDRMGRPQGLVQRIIDTATRRRVDKIIIEDKTRGKDVKDELIRQMGGENFQIELWNPQKHGDKVARLYGCQPLFSQKLVYAPGNYEIVKDPVTGKQFCEVREELKWVQAVVQEVASVPRGKHDDLADCTSMGLLWLRENGFLPLTRQHLENQMRERLWQPHRPSISEAYGV